jgi:hypothetical protein
MPDGRCTRDASVAFLVVLGLLLKQRCVGNATVAWPMEVPCTVVYQRRAVVVFDYGRVVDHQWHRGGVPSGAGRLSVPHFGDEAGEPFLLGTASLAPPVSYPFWRRC